METKNLKKAIGFLIAITVLIVLFQLVNGYTELGWFIGCDYFHLDIINGEYIIGGI